MIEIRLPFPSSSLSGHAKGNGQWKKIADTKKHREWAYKATLAVNPIVPSEGDIHLHVIFIPPNRRGDRVNFPNRMKPYFDGIADALCVNDSRFLPAYHFVDAGAPGEVVVIIS